MTKFSTLLIAAFLLRLLAVPASGFFFSVLPKQEDTSWRIEKMTTQTKRLKTRVMAMPDGGRAFIDQSSAARQGGGYVKSGRRFNYQVSHTSMSSCYGGAEGEDGIIEETRGFEGTVGERVCADKKDCKVEEGKGVLKAVFVRSSWSNDDRKRMKNAAAVAL